MLLLREELDPKMPVGLGDAPLSASSSSRRDMSISAVSNGSVMRIHSSFSP